MDLDRNITQARGDNAELELRWTLGQKPGKLRVVGYWNHAYMGDYQQTIDTPNLGLDITLSRQYRMKYGYGLNLEQALADNFGFFTRFGWNDGATESWAFTEVDRTASLGVEIQGRVWGRNDDQAGIGMVVNGLSEAHADYLRDGGYGFIIGDGRLNYAPEMIAEIYYSFALLSGLSASPDFQWINHPAYNQDRGPVAVFAVRMHYEI